MTDTKKAASKIVWLKNVTKLPFVREFTAAVRTRSKPITADTKTHTVVGYEVLDKSVMSNGGFFYRKYYVVKDGDYEVYAPESELLPVGAKNPLALPGRGRKTPVKKST